MRYVVFAVALCMTGCATLFHGSDQTVQINSTPSAATVEVDGRPVGETPTTAALERGDSYRLRIYHEGYEPHSVTLRSERSLWAALNLFNLFLPGLLIDASTGAFYSLEPDEISAELDSVASQPDSMAAPGARLNSGQAVPTTSPQ